MTAVDTFDLASLEAFTSDLVGAGFEPEPGTLGRWWHGPAHPAFASLSTETRMRICIRDGWPVVFPVIFMSGIHTNHLTEGGYVCLWHDGDGSGDWLTVEGLFGRIEQWCQEALDGWDPKGLARDAQLNFTPKHPTVATFDLDGLGIGNSGSWGAFYGELPFPWHVELRPGSGPKSEHLDGLWFQVGSLDVPPRNLLETRLALQRPQRRGLDRKLGERKGPDVLVPSGGVDLILFCWKREENRHVLALAVQGVGDEMSLTALQPGPNDETSLLLRAGPDASDLHGKAVAVFGLGALGGHAAVCLAESGVGRLRLVDSDVILPGNVVRHVAGQQAVGVPKVAAVKIVIADHAPWAAVDVVGANPLSPAKLQELVGDVDLIVDTTGTEAGTQALAAIADAAQKPLVSGALYRGGAVARVQRQGMPGDVPIADRTHDPSYRLIPPGPEGDELVEPAVGCSAPINNAPPSSVLACASLVAQSAIDALVARCELPDEVSDVYRVLDGEPPFDRLGRVASS